MLLGRDGKDLRIDVFWILNVDMDMGGDFTALALTSTQGIISTAQA